eukprot:TRINITY_DN27197_c0_g1_i2.p3 TRINITY_DN27197_c0_g1~~TRINITY_DN27197_c0_g1_i2.p3  ORF type:complete len:280 (+),score=65.71 TRINITY_DN27197_c0_g1_i2:921-1760(+)
MIDPILKLASPLEIVCFEFNPQDPFVIVGGAINGQILMWDIRNAFAKFTEQSTKKGRESKADKHEVAPTLNHVLISTLQDPSGLQNNLTMDQLKKNLPSHKSSVLSIKWLPHSIRFDKKNFFNLLQNTSDKQYQFASISEDGQVLFWDTEFPPDKDPRQLPELYFWKAHFGIQLFRPDGGGLLGGSHIMFHKESKISQFYGTSDEGDLFLVDWTTRPTDENPKSDMVIKIWSSERNYRHCVSLDLSAFFDDIILVLFDFHFCIFKAGIEVPLYLSLIHI